jgi:putative two-component system response regulator
MRKDIVQNSRILIIDDKPENVLLLERILTESGYRHLRGITDSREALQTFFDFQPDLVALDLRMPHVDGIDVLKQMRSRIPPGDFVPVLVLTADNSQKTRREALSLGAKDFVTKPLVLAEVLLRIYNLLETRWLHVALQRYNFTLEEKVRDRTNDLEEAQLEILQRLALAAEYRDDCTGRHTHRVGQLAALLGSAVGLPAGHIELIRRAAPLHDVGKIGIPDSILLKPGKLTSEEYAQVKTHTDIGRSILSGSKFPILQMAESIAMYHHERWDGLGYNGLKEESTPVEARIVAVVDVFDVITHARPYKEAQTRAVAIDCIREEAGKQFDPALAQAFVQLQHSGDLGKLGEALDQQAGVKAPENDRIAAEPMFGLRA